MVGELINLLPFDRAQLNARRRRSPWQHAYTVLDAVKDPEVPVLSLWDLGVLQDIQGEVLENGQSALQVVVTPTYAGCPALTQMQQDVKAALAAAGYARISIEIQLAPAWTTDWLDADARKRLREYGVAPPTAGSKPACPQCGSSDVQAISEFGSTACKALWQCGHCAEPFDYFKPI